MANKNGAVDAAAEEIVPETGVEAAQNGETEAQAPVAEQPADALTDAPAATGHPTPADGVQKPEASDEETHDEQDAGADDHKDGAEPLTADAVKAIINEALAPIVSRLDALEKTADTNEVNKLAGRLRHIEQRVRGFL